MNYVSFYISLLRLQVSIHFCIFINKKVNFTFTKKILPAYENTHLTAVTPLKDTKDVSSHHKMFPCVKCLFHSRIQTKLDIFADIWHLYYFYYFAVGLLEMDNFVRVMVLNSQQLFYGFSCLWKILHTLN